MKQKPNESLIEISVTDTIACEMNVVDKIVGDIYDQESGGLDLGDPMKVMSVVAQFVSQEQTTVGYYGESPYFLAFGLEEFVIAGRRVGETRMFSVSMIRNNEGEWIYSKDACELINEVPFLVLNKVEEQDSLTKFLFHIDLSDERFIQNWLQGEY